MTSTQEVTPGNLSSLTGLRAVGMLFVFVAHGAAASVFADKGVAAGYNALIDNGVLGFLAVSFFFVLSGFVLTWSARPGARRFWRRRLLRVFPNHLVVLVVSALTFVAAGETIRLVPAVANVFLVQNWWPDADLMYYQLNGPTWTLSVELLCYAAFPLLYALVNRIKPGRLWFWLAVVGLVALAMPLLSEPFLAGYGPSKVFGVGSWPQQWFLYFFPITRSLEFVLGMILCKIIQTGRWVRVPVVVSALCVLGVYVVLYFLPQNFVFAALYPIPMALLIGSVATSDLAGRSRVMNSRLMVRLGDISFAFYIVHIPVLFSVHAAFAGEWVGYANHYTRTQWNTPTGIAFLVGAYLLCVLAAWVLRTVVEIPAMRRWGGSRRRGTSGLSRPKAPGPQLQA
ncbi:acyltransferase family protein [Streptosporangium sp. NPDC001559]|uniref:acyltransferase family protein n=1 Tax=Streptosporangium sp. NPDC001559 TaxID=3366187 RepID=UPI0036E4FC8B